MVLRVLLVSSLPRPLEVQFRGNDDDCESVEQEEVVDEAEEFPKVDDERRRHICDLFSGLDAPADE